jgi:hypothetical protein
MANEFDHSDHTESTPSPAQLEFLEALLAPEGDTYPWDITDPETEAYFAEREQDFILEDWSEEEIAAQTQTFFSQIEQIWPAPDATDATVVNNLQANLQQRFAAHIPQSWLKTIAYKAYQVLKTKPSMADQLVQCIQELLPNWAEDDLLVLARPFAYSMRGADTDEFVLGNVPSQDWKALSEIEKARTGLAIAQYALAQLQKGQ